MSKHKEIFFKFREEIRVLIQGTAELQGVIYLNVQYRILFFSAIPLRYLCATLNHFTSKPVAPISNNLLASVL